MPHKRAKRSVRETEAQKKGYDLAPSGSTRTADEAIPKRLAWVLGAEKVRNDYNERKRTRNNADGGEVEGGKAVKKRKKEDDPKASVGQIMAGESLGDFNRRVENTYRSTVRKAVKSSSKEGKKMVKASIAEKTETEGENKDDKDKAQKEKEKEKEKPKKPDAPRAVEFARLDSRKRVGDVVMAPPTLTKFPRKSGGIGGKKDKIPLTGAQLRMMEEERERVIMRYREMKEQKRGGAVAR